MNRLTRFATSATKSSDLVAIERARCDRMEARADKLATLNADLLAALQSIANNTCCGPCQEAALVARSAIAKATEQS